MVAVLSGLALTGTEALLAACAFAGAGPARTGSAWRAASLAAQVIETAPRPFEHRRHESVSCLTCHGTGEQHGLIRMRTAADCASCHHDPVTAPDCAACHRNETLPEQRSIAASMTLAEAATPRDRMLPFGHAVHLAAQCGECHQTAVTLAVAVTCNACHDRHHEAKADCAQCHRGFERDASHTARAHLGCTGAGCHTSSALPEPTASRTLCLACHTEQRDHEPAGDCARCHRIPSRHAQRVTGGGS